MRNVSLPILAAVPPATLKEVTEAMFQRAVIEFAKAHGWLWYAVDKTAQRAKSGRYYSLGPPGFPDLVMLRNGVQLTWELKSEDGRVTEDQFKWLAHFKEAGAQTGIYRPRDSAELMRRLK